MTEEQDRFGLSRPYDISDAQVASLRERGWLALPGLLSAAAVVAIREDLASMKEREALKPSDSAYERNPVANGNRKKESVAHQSPFLRELVVSPRLGGVATRLMRLPAVLFAQDMSFVKPAHGAPTGFHQDLPFFPFDRGGSISIWIALMDMTPAMGPLRYLDGSHRDGVLGRLPNRDIRDIYPDLYDREVVAGTELRAGDAQVHLDLTIHGAAENHTDVAREAYAIRYMRPDTVYTGTGHPHYDKFASLTVGESFEQSGDFWKIDTGGLAGGPAASHETSSN